MNIRSDRVAVFIVVALAMVAAFAALICSLLAQQVDVPGYASPQLHEIAAISVFLLIAPLLGGLLAARFPRNAIGWLFIIVPASLAVSFAADTYGMWARHVAGDESLTPAAVMLVGGTVGGVAFGGIGLIALLFPTGTLPSRRWWAVVSLLVVSQLALTAQVLHPDFNINRPGLANPFAVAELTGILDVLEFLGVVGTVGGLLAGAGALVRRFRRAQGVERLQLKWFAFAVALTTAVLVAAVASDVARLPDAVTDAVWVAAIASLSLWPIAAGIAILRHRLYDIDLLINRTLVYGVTSAAIAAIFFGGIVALQTLLRPVTAGSELAIAASTLLSFALFQPIRRRVQERVDRRFDRSRYDAARTLDDFADRVRDEVDLDTLSADLLAVVRDTIQPTHASVWLREAHR